MDYLPAEITANIISHLAEDGGDNRLLQYATVSRRWQQIIEAKSFAHVTLIPARLASPLAAQALTPNRVRRFVRTIEAELLLPPYNKEARGQRRNHKVGRSAGLGGEAVTAKLQVEGQPVFHPDTEVMQAWREAARAHVGAESRLEVIITKAGESRR